MRAAHYVGCAVLASIAGLSAVLGGCSSGSDNDRREEVSSELDRCQSVRDELDIDGELSGALGGDGGYIDCVFLSSGPTATTVVCPDGRTMSPRIRQIVRISSDGGFDVRPAEIAGNPC